MAARLAAERVRRGQVAKGEREEVEACLRAGQGLAADRPVAAFIRADLAFHKAVYRLSGNPVIADMLLAQWPHLMRAMGVVLEDPDYRLRAWAEHARILEAVLMGDPSGAEAASRAHATDAGAETVRRLTGRDAAA
jgi:DNA-binding FadR family transcriptional regulator